MALNLAKNMKLIKIRIEIVILLLGEEYVKDLIIGTIPGVYNSPFCEYVVLSRTCCGRQISS